jgi:NADPH-dependent 2,4-dienoyl-CoA reductase/sulfur reductase-like enzyme
VIGAGPTGLAAATAVARAGVEVALFDEQPAPGGQIFRTIEEVPQVRADMLGADYRRGSALVSEFRASGARYYPDSTIWSVDATREFGVLRAGRARLWQAERILISGGAMERPVAFPGWTLPGVMYAGAGQILLKSAGLVPAEGVVLAGSGPLLLLLAWQYMRAGVTVRALLDLTPWRNWLRALPRLPAALRARHYLFSGLGYQRDLRRAGVPYIHGVSELRAIGGERLEAVAYRHRGRRRTLETGLLLVHFGLLPQTTLTRAAGCAHDWDERQVCWRPRVDVWGNTSVPGIGVAGDNATIGGARAAGHAGRLAAFETLRALGRIDREERDRLAAADRRWLVADLHIRPFLETLYRPSQDVLVAEEEATIVCRCEEVTVGEIRRALREGHTEVNQVKYFTRCGMGPCQGRQCGPALGHLLATAQGRPVDTVGAFRARPPLKPITLAQLAAIETGPPADEG